MNETNCLRCLAVTLWVIVASMSAPVALGADTATAVFDPAFRSLQVQSSNGFMAQPVVRLGTDDRVVITFDEIGDDFSQLQYSLVHCNADWQPSRLLESEYVESFNIADVDDYAFSSNTFIHYVNYRIEVPNDQMQPLVSGNYLLRIYDRDEPSETLLQARFAVSEDAVALAGSASGRTDRGFNSSWQQLEFEVKTPNFDIANPFQDLAVTVTQNNTPWTLRTVRQPMRVEGSKVVFAHAPELIFDAGNEFRRFETVRINYPGMHVDSMRYVGPDYHAYLMTDSPRAGHDYRYDKTQHGRYKIDEYLASDPDLGADYVTVHFTLEGSEIPGARIYVDGDLTLHHLGQSTRMDYDRSLGAYTLELPLKQGSYNYRYVIVPPGARLPDPAPVEGNLFETINEYQLQVFYRPAGARADRLIGHGTILTQP